MFILLVDWFSWLIHWFLGFVDLFWKLVDWFRLLIDRFMLLINWFWLFVVVEMNWFGCCVNRLNMRASKVRMCLEVL